MAEPKTIGGIFLTDIAAGASIAWAAMGAFRAGQAAAQRGALQAELFRRSEKQRLDLAAANARDFARNASARQARLRLLQGVSGATKKGTPGKIEDNFAAESEFQRLKIIHGGDVAASRDALRAIFAETQGRNLRQQAFLRGGAKILKGAGQAFG